MNFKPIASGYCFLEAPRADGDALWYTDLLLGGIYRLSPGGEVKTFLADRQHIGGVALNEDGRIICGGPGGIAWLDASSGESGVVLEAVDGVALSGVNDMFADGKGGLYFGTMGPAEEGGQSASKAIYRLDSNGNAALLADGLQIANGMGISPDGKRLYHSESLAGIFAYDIQPDGSLGEKALFAPREDGDGLAVDSQGYVWVASFSEGELIRLAPDGKVAQLIPVPHRAVTSLCFGGPDWRDMYVTTAGDEGVNALMRGELPPREACVFHARVDVPGLPVPRTNFLVNKKGY